MPTLPSQDQQYLQESSLLQGIHDHRGDGWGRREGDELAVLTAPHQLWDPIPRCQGLAAALRHG